jgi:hypothetical protein
MVEMKTNDCEDPRQDVSSDVILEMRMFLDRRHLASGSADLAVVVRGPRESLRVGIPSRRLAKMVPVCLVSTRNVLLAC